MIGAYSSPSGYTRWNSKLSSDGSVVAISVWPAARMAPRSWANSASRTRRFCGSAASALCRTIIMYVPLASNSPNMIIATKATRRIGLFTAYAPHGLPAAAAQCETYACIAFGHLA